MTLTENDGRWLCRKSPKAKTVEDVTDIIVFDGDFASLMGRAGRTEFHAYLHKSGNKWLQMYGVTSLLGYWGEKDKLVQWAVDRTVDHIGAWANPLLEDDEDGAGYIKDGLEVKLGEARKAHKTSLNSASATGTLIHSEIEHYIKKCIEYGGKLHGVGYEGSDQLKLFMMWAMENDVEFLASEKVVYSKRLWVAGTLDALCIWNGKRYLLDIKTSNWISPKHFLQCGGYAEMLDEPVDGCVIVQLPRSGGINVVTNDDVGVGISELQKGFEGVVSLVKMDKLISSNLYN